MIPEQAQRMAALGCRLVPIGAGQKHPPISEWQLRATSDAETLEGWWGTHPEWGVGWKMGAQDDGRSLFAIDVDVDKGGLESFRQLMQESGLGPEFRRTTTARTGGGGFHFVFQLPPGASVVPSNRSKLAPGIDIRAENGQICVEPTVHPNGRSYGWEAGKAPWELAPELASSRLMALVEVLQAPPVVTMPRAVNGWHPSAGSQHEGDFVREFWDWATFLIKHGWVHLGGEAWKRPGKADRGKSALLKNGGRGPLNIFTTEIPLELDRLGVPDATGQCVSVSLFDFVAAYEHGGDRRALAARVRADPMYGPGAPVAGESPGTGAPLRAAGVDAPATVPPPPELDWSASPLLAHVKAAAEATWAAPFALLVHALCRASALIPPCYRLPGLVSREVGTASLDLMGCIVGETGTGKSYAGNIARDLVVDPELGSAEADRRVLMDLPIGSGEGLVDAFFEEVEVPDDSKKGSRRVTKVVHTGLFLVADEGNAFVAMKDRKGVTITETMTQAWTGETLGNLNTRTGGRRRTIRAGLVRFSAVLNIQSSNAWKLFDEKMTTVGFPGRLLFAQASDPNTSRERGEWPGPLGLPMWKAFDPHIAPQLLTYDPSISAEIEEIRFAAIIGVTPEDLIRSQHLVLACKVAGVLALIDDRTHVSEADWALSGAILTASSSVLESLVALHARQLSDLSHRSAELAGEREYIVKTTAERRLLAEYKAKAIKAVRAGRTSRRDIEHDYRSDYRKLMRQAIDELLDEGSLTIVDGSLAWG